MKEDVLEVSDILYHYGESGLPYNAVVPPMVQSSIFCFDTFEEFRDAAADEAHHYLYSRGNNPTVELCERKIAALEHGERAKLVSSGVAAISAAVMPWLKNGDHVVAVDDCYSWAHYLFSEYLKRFGVEVTFVEGCDVSDFENAVRDNTRLIYLESPATFTFKLQPLKEVAALARKKGIKTVIDNTWATPLFQNPIDFGIDLIVHSTTKYLGGNSDLIGGVIVGSEADIARIFNEHFLALGPVPDPFMAWLILRNLRNLAVRMPVHGRNALELAKWLENREEVEMVNYPLLESFPQHDLAVKQLRGGSGLFSARLKTRNLDEVIAFTNSLKYFKIACSWGGYESLVDPCAINYPEGTPVPDDRVSLIRFHAGLEDLDVLKKDLENAFEAMKG